MKILFRIRVYWSHKNKNKINFRDHMSSVASNGRGREAEALLSTSAMPIALLAYTIRIETYTSSYASS